MVAGGGEEHLGLVGEAAEGLGVDDPVPVALEGEADGALLFGAQAALAVAVETGMGGEITRFSLLHFMAEAGGHFRYDDGLGNDTYFWGGGWSIAAERARIIQQAQKPQ
jgi:hypothetical protein